MANLTKIVAALCGALLLAPAGAAPSALTQSAIISAKAGSAVMLAVARAGPRLGAVGERGIVQLSDTNGSSWRQVATPVQVSLAAVQFVNERSGWAVGHLGVVLHTDDGGLTWRKQLDGIEAAELMARAAVSTEDKAAAARMREDGPDKPFLDLYFQDENTGYVVGAYNLAFRTSDGGKHWQPWQSHLPNPKSLHLYGMRGAGTALYLVGEQGSLFRSADGGATFDAVTSPYKGSYFGLVTARSGEIVVFGLRGTAFWSGDQGRNWQPVDTGMQQAITAGIELADGTLALLSQGGDLLFSDDRGRTFARQPNPQPWPSAALVQAADKTLVLAGLRGVRRQQTFTK